MGDPMPPRSNSTVRMELDDSTHIATVILQRPEAMNAISRQLATELREVCNDIRANAEIRVVILAGAGDRAFSAGADLRERRGLSAAERTEHTLLIEAAVEDVAALPMPTIAVVRGYALAGGAELAIACDIRAVSDDASLGFPEVKVGIFPGAGGVLRGGRGLARRDARGCHR